MATKAKQASCIIKKHVGHEGKRYVGEVLKYSPGHFVLVISQLKETTTRQEFREPQQVRQLIEKIRPLNLNNELLPKEAQKRQSQIDKYLENSTIAEALEIVDVKGNDGKKTKARRIQAALGYEVERWMEEKIAVENIPVMRDVTEVKAKELEEISMYHRPNGRTVQLSIINYLKSLK